MINSRFEVWKAYERMANRLGEAQAQRERHLMFKKTKKNYPIIPSVEFSYA